MLLHSLSTCSGPTSGTPGAGIGGDGYGGSGTGGAGGGCTGNCRGSICELRQFSHLSFGWLRRHTCYLCVGMCYMQQTVTAFGLERLLDAQYGLEFMCNAAMSAVKLCGQEYMFVVLLKATLANNQPCKQKQSDAQHKQRT